MDSFTGLKALRKKIELILQKLNMYQDKMNEISREELLEIMGNNDLDLSWIASQESVDALRSEIDEIKKMVNKINKDTMKTVGTAADISIFEAVISGSYMTIYGPVVTDPEGEVTIYSQYIGGSTNTAYSTKLTSGGTSNREIRLTKCSSLTIQDSVTLPSDTRYDVIDEICNNNLNLVSVDIGNLIGYAGGNTWGRFTSSTTGNLNRYGMFSGCTKLSNVSIGYMYTQNAVGMFDGCESLTSLDLTGLKIDANGKVDEMFYGCTNLKEILVSRSKFPESFKSSTDMFTGCGVDHVTYVD